MICHIEFVVHQELIKSLSNLTSEDLGIEDLNLALNLSTRLQNYEYNITNNMKTQQQKQKMKHVELYFFSDLGLLPQTKP